MGLFGKHKQGLQSKGAELMPAIAASMPRWFDKLGESVPEVQQPHKPAWCYFTGISAAFFALLVLQQQGGC